MKLLIDQLIVLDRAFYRYYLEMLLTLEHTHALTPWQMSILLWRAKIFHVEILYPELLRISIGNEQEKDEIRFMKMWKLKELEKAHKAAVAEATKAYTTAAKESDKAIKLATAELTKADADLLKLVPTVAPTVTAKPEGEKAVPTETA